MGYKTLHECVLDLERHNHLIRIKEEVDPYLEMASIHLRTYEQQGPAILFENVKGSQFMAVSNLFGTLERSKFIFRDTFTNIQKLVGLKFNPLLALKHPFKYVGVATTAFSALPMKVSGANFKETTIDKVPLIQNWVMDGGAFVTLPQVYTEDVDSPGIMNANLGMYRIQLSGNEYKLNSEIGLHYQLHRGIGIHQTKSNNKGQPLKVSIFVGGPPAHSLAAVMPLPEGLSEMTFAGALNNRRFRYYYDADGHCISADADFVITGEVYPMENKPEGPFGDHLGYYSLKHDFPVMRVKKVYHKPDALWAFTVVGRPPQEDTSFGALIHELTGSAIPLEIPGVHAIHAVDAAGVHPLLFAIGSERYTPYLEQSRPQELLTIANQILGKNQLSLAKFLFITNYADAPMLDIHNEPAFLQHLLERINLQRDLHFYTNFTIDTLDYSGTDINSGSKIVLAATGKPIRILTDTIDEELTKNQNVFTNVKCIMKGIIAFSTNKFSTYEQAKTEFEIINSLLLLSKNLHNQTPLLVWCDDADFVAATTNNFLWATFTRCNPSHDVYGVNTTVTNKHWGCDVMVIDARIKPHHAPELKTVPEIETRVDAIINRLNNPKIGTV
ncbi:MAG: UbiD family decarboxylase [Bacteroidia bacterium]|nr:UbiD family decarboxylase [Bacteroidia bacterium]